MRAAPHLKTVSLALLLGLLAGCSGSRPVQLGEARSNLSPCPESPNCVSSMASQEDESHYIAPLTITEKSANQQSPMQALSAIVTAQKGAEIVVSTDQYLYAEFTTNLMRFVDDVEFLYQPGENRIDVRSASRLGYADFDANRDRIESIRQQFQEVE